MLNRCVQRIEVEERQVQQLSMRQGEPFKADWYISAAPFDRLLDLLGQS